MKKMLLKYRVMINTLFFILALAFSHYQKETWIAGFVLALAGFTIRAWAAGHIEKNVKLTTSGPYSLVRHPLYLGSFLVMVGMGVGGALWWLLVCYFPIFFYIHTLAALEEERLLAVRFGTEYQLYASRTPRFVPRSFRFTSSEGKWSLRRFTGNREYHLAIVVIFYFIWVFAGHVFVKKLTGLLQF